jgi:acetyl esterase/lipase
VDYPLAPEHPYPAALDGIRAAYLALLEQGQDPGGLVVAGDSAGGGLVLSLLLALGRDGLPAPACGVLLSPWVDLTLSGTSMRAMRSRDPMLPVRWLELCARRYAGGKRLTEALLSPLNADLRDLPPLLLQVGSEEVLLSDSLRLALRLSSAGQPFDLEIREGCWHVWHLFAPWLPEAGAAIDAAAAHARRHLRATKPVGAALAEGGHGRDGGGRLSRRA